MSLRHRLYLEKEKVKRRLKRLQYGNCTVLLYHRIADASYDPQQLCVSPQLFQSQLKHLKQHYHFLTVSEFDAHLMNRKPFKKNSLLISFDDGYADNLHNAIPILEEEGLEAIFYISIKNLNTNSLFWWDELDLLFKYPEKVDQTVLSLLLEKYNEKDFRDLYSNYLILLKRATSLANRDNYLNEIRKLREIAEEEKKEYLCLTFEECRTLSDSKSVVIGAHSINHLSLACLNETDQEFEIKQSLVELSNIIQKPISYFSYPYGERNDYNEISIKVCEELKLSHAAANYGGYVDCNSDPYSFTRFVVRNDLPDILNSKLKGVL